MMVSIEQHVDWIGDCMTHLRDDGNDVIEATVEAEDAWVEHVNEVGDSDALPAGQLWYMGANVPGKPRVLMPYIGGVGAYRTRVRRDRRPTATAGSNCEARCSPQWANR